MPVQNRQQEILNKYRDAAEDMEKLGIQIAESRMEGDKLYILAFAPSEQAKNQVWDRIKAADPTYSDLTCDIRVGQKHESVAGQDERAVFDNAVGGAAPGSLARGLSAAFHSDQTPAFGEMVGHLFGNSSPDQKAGLLNQLFAIMPSSLVGEVIGMVGGKRQMTPEEAQSVPLEAVQKAAEKAEQHDPSIVDKVSEFYAQHPGLVKTLGVGALTVTVSHMLGKLRGGSGGT
jgi:hypothetical protein